MPHLSRSLLFFLLLIPAPKPAPDFTRPALDGTPIRISALRGQVILLNFWATWCGPCQEEMPRFVHWQQAYGSQGLRVLGVSMDDDATPVRALAPKMHWNYPILMGDARLGRLYGGVLGLPVTYLIDRHGRIRARLEGATDLPALEARIRALLAEPAPK